MLESKFEISVGMSRKWDARKAGREVAENAIKNLTRPPNFFLLFSTIHYEKHGGFEEFLSGVWDVLPKGTPLVGGTVAGFINSKGSFARGATSLAFSYPNMDIYCGIGRHVKRNPKSAAKSCANMIRNGLKKSRFKNKLLFEMISGPIFPSVPLFGEYRIIKDKKLSYVFALLSQASTSILLKGAARESETLNYLSEELEDFTILGGSSMDDCRYISNYQFYNEKVYSDALIGLGIQTDLKPTIKSASGLIPIGDKFEISKDMCWGHIICSIDDKPAVEKYLDVTKWPKTILDDRVYTKTIYYPLGSVIDNDTIIPNVIALFVGDYIVLAHSLQSKKICLLTTSGKRLTDAVDTALQNIDNNFGFGVSCAIRMQTLGKNINIIQKKLKEKFNESFLVIYTPGESVCIPDKNVCHHYQNTFNICTLYNSDFNFS
ncbi:MAG: hypothetical protein BV457_02735 [Thermoplasmata archaeon M9B1D]|nr:MAG: hypothetical protein BV457_02735 [Thermoplasmata archaeon M9B1D]PNX50240.1 MAG: hypothetical protein BV456_07320 [Thermoplasmata archaeon M8B2D]